LEKSRRGDAKSEGENRDDEGKTRSRFIKTSIVYYSTAGLILFQLTASIPHFSFLPIVYHSLLFLIIQNTYHQRVMVFPDPARGESCMMMAFWSNQATRTLHHCPIAVGSCFPRSVRFTKVARFSSICMAGIMVVRTSTVQWIVLVSTRSDEERRYYADLSSNYDYFSCDDTRFGECRRVEASRPMIYCIIRYPWV